eukprot:CAMPEP_0178467408 /NCGR_PEP_ID=MMETSP0689_2-20121128/52396_1 /TAXON_ID=160604 /ORGANISM="Amphidinium massartii, Strain CS-259" /LENGTH=1492 /DNA_ID=CAMNT_0020094447 /DNA_START=72 /DNA_END=4551 /DNA_ORIENTATION=-
MPDVSFNDDDDRGRKSRLKSGISVDFGRTEIREASIHSESTSSEDDESESDLNDFGEDDSEDDGSPKGAGTVLERVRRKSLTQLRSLTRGLTRQGTSISRGGSISEPLDAESLPHTPRTEPIDSDNGFVTDYLERLRGQASGGPDSAAQGPVLGNVRMLAKHITGLRSAVPHLHQERLMSQINDALLSKALRLTSTATLSRIFRTRIAELVKYKRSKRCLEQETTFWQIRKVAMLKKNTLRRAEKDADRRDRLEDFWADLHESPRRPSLWWNCDEKIRRPGTPGEPLRGANETALKKEALVGSRRPSRQLDWKDRTSKSRCTQGGWDMAETQRSLMSSSSEPTLRTTATSKASVFRRSRGLDALEGEENSDDDEPFVPPPPPSKAPKRLVEEPQPLQQCHVRPSFYLRNTAAHIEAKDQKEDPLAARVFKRQQVRYKPPVFPVFDDLPKPQAAVTHKAEDVMLPLIHVNRHVGVEEIRGSPSKGGVGAPAKRYLRECQHSKVVPILLPFVTGHSHKLNAKSKLLTDIDIATIGATARGMLHIEELDFEENSALTDRGLVPFLHMLHTHPATSALEHLSLRGCIRAGPATAEVVNELIEGPCGKLRHLDLCGVQLGQRARLPICKAIKDHPSLRSVHLADTGFSGEDTATNIDILFGSSTLEELDLGWNSFTEDVYEAMGRRMLETQTVKTLALANSATASAPITPVVVFMELIARDEVLTKLDLSMNHIDHRAALVIEDALQSHPHLKELNVSNNPLGIVGLRCLLRLLSRNESSLLHFQCRHCDGDCDDADVVFNSTNPSGTYLLDMQKAYHRTLLRMLLKTMEAFNLSYETAFRLQPLDGPANPFRLPKHPPIPLEVEKELKNGLWCVPMEGRFNIVFSIESAMEARMGRSDYWSFYDVLTSHRHATQLRPGFHKVVPLIALWRSLTGSFSEQRLFLNAISKDFLLTAAFVEVLLSDATMAVDVLARLVPNIDGPRFHQYLTMMRLPSLGDYLRLMNQLRSFFLFNPDNPTGHYSLDLGDAVDYAVAEQLLIIDSWEATVARHLNRVDVSQKKNGSNFRNEYHNGNPLFGSLASIAEWVLPQTDILEFDYCSGKRQRQGAAPLQDDVFDRIFLSLQSSKCQSMEQVEVLRMASHRINLTATQMRQLLVMYEDDAPRAEIFTVLFFRIVDIHNEKIFRVRFEKHEELHKLQRMLGKVTCFPFMQPDQARFEYDFKFWDERLACNILFQLSAREGWGNLQEACMVNEEGHSEMLESIPKSWEVLDRMPTIGTFKAAYTCAPEDREFKLRRRLLERYGFWETHLQNESDVRWWTSLQDSPAEVRDFLAWVVRRYTDVYEVLREITGGAENIEIEFAEFADGVLALDCQIFENDEDEEHEERCLLQIFRFIDRNNTGFITKPKWRILEQLWREMQYSINEFCIFIERAFGMGLKKPWAFLDKDKDGFLTAEEWEQSCQQIGYFGHAMPIFQFLDKDGEGCVKFKDFQHLHSFRR